MGAQADEFRAEFEVKLAALEGEIGVRRAREAATTRILQAIAAGPQEAARAIDLIAESATVLCGAYDAVVLLRQDGHFVRAGHHGPIPMDLEQFPVSPRSTTGRCVLERRSIHVHDLLAAGDEFPDSADMARRFGHRTILSVPLLRGDEAIGSIALRRFEVNPFGQDDIALLATFADQAVIAVENTRLVDELRTRSQEITEALERQTATSEILATISRSPTDVQPVFDAIAGSAARLCEAEFCHVFRFDGAQVDFVAHNYGESAAGALKAAEVARTVFPMVPDATSAAGRVLLTGSLVNIPDVHADSDYALGEIAKLLGYRSIMGVPMLRDGRTIGAITVMRSRVGAFADRQIDLLKTFADQAVIAIENTRLFGELHESLRQQTATADVLKAISQSAFDLQRVFEVVGENALRLCGADKAFIFRFDGEVLRSVVAKNASPELLDFVARNPIRPGRHTATARAALLRQTVYIEDVSVDPDFSYGARDIDPLRTTLSVPILKGDDLLGVITIYRLEVKPFTQNQIALIETFADQAAIAIESVRLLTDLRDALQQQTAMADVLRAISRSTFDLGNVLTTLVQAAVRLCEADQGTIARGRDGVFVRAASHGFSSEFMAAVLDKPVALDRGSATGRALVERRLVHIPDVALDPDYDFAGALQYGGFRTLVGVPMLRDGAAIGVFALTRREARPFTEKQMELLASFADQAAIAIENARLFEAVQGRTSELEKALEQQTATSAILRVIASSPADLAPVLKAVAENAARLCGAADAQIFRVRGDMLYLEASFGSIPIHFREAKINRGWVTGRAVVDRRTIHIHDLAAEPEEEFPLGREMQCQHGHRTTLATPLVKQGLVLGAILIRRMEVQPFSDDQIRLLETFADQAAIAIENARLFEALQARTGEVQEALEQQTATSEILAAISTSMTDAQPVFDAIVRSAVSLCGSLFANVFRFDGEHLHFVASHNVGPGYVQLLQKKYPMRPDPSQVSGRVIISKAVVRLEDAHADPEYDQKFPAAMAWRRMLGVPMLRDGVPIGAIVVGWAEAGPILGRQEELLKTFADQAVIAIENARLFQALEAALSEFNAVLDNIDYGVLFMDRDLRARIVNPALRRLWDIPQELIDRRPTMRELLEYNRDRGVYTTPPQQWDEWVARRIERVRQGSVRPGEFVRADGKVYSYQCVALPDGGRMLSYFDITELKNRQAELLTAKEAAEMALAELRTAQERLVQSEKLASLGQLTAGIAHEIKNPLNFVNNFASLSHDMLAELEAVLQAPIAALETAERDDAEDLFRTVRENLDKIAHHGKRADSIVKNMLLHARQGSGEWREADINAIAEEALNLAYHGARAGHPDFNVEIVKRLDPTAGAIECCPQDIMRVVLNLVSNGIYAANKKRPSAPAGFMPRIELTTREKGATIAIEVRDNGTGIPTEIRESIFLPFFTTKPAGEGTGLGLSLSHDIVVKQHGGSFSVESEPGAFTLFRVVLPRRAVQGERA